jgi:hypothetical protein
MVAVLLITTLIYTLILPPFEAPDETTFHLPRLLGQNAGMLHGGETVIASSLAKLAAVTGVAPASVVRCSQLSPNGRLAYGSNAPALQHGGQQCPLGSYLTLRTGYALALVGIFCLIFFTRPLMLASLAFPSALFCATQISTDAVNAQLCLFAGYLALKRRPTAVLLVAIVAVVNDRSATALLAFALTIAGAEAMPAIRSLLASRAGALIGLVTGLTIGLTARLLAGRIVALASLYVDVLYNSKFGTNPVRQAGALFLSSWYLGGNMSFTAFYIEYVAFATLLVALYLAPRQWFALPAAELDQVRFVISATVLVMAAVVSIIQPLTQARYYLFFVPAAVCAISGALRVKPSALLLGFAGLNIAYALSATLAS